MDSVNISVTFHPSAKTISLEPGISLRKAGEIAGADFGMPCGGNGRCGKCKVYFEQGAPVPTATELDLLDQEDLAKGYRLGCQTVLDTDAVVHFPNGVKSAKMLTTGTTRKTQLNPSISKQYVRVPEPSVDDLRSDLKRIFDFLDPDIDRESVSIAALRQLGKNFRDADFGITVVSHNGRIIALEPGDTTSECYGVAFDIGTTTIAAYLLDLNTGEQISVTAAMNPQVSMGDDVISRISHVMDNSDGLEKLRKSVVNELNTLTSALTDMAGVSYDKIYEATVVGNTCMMHLFLGVDPRCLAVAPYVPAFNQSFSLNTSELGIDINESGRIYVLPCIAGYVGADTVGVGLATGLYEDDQLTLAVDIGTNGEMLLGSKDRMLACSTAAGPAFEGAHIRHGMRAAPGAIDSVRLDGNELNYSTIADAEAVGICGSGLLDAICCLVKVGIIDSSGRIVDADEVPEGFAELRERILTGEKGNEFILVTADKTSLDGPVVIAQRDVREIQLAKGAIAAGIYTLLDGLGINPEDIDRIVLAGAFGNYISKESAIFVGMLPDVPLDKVHSVGNAAGEGAKLALISRDIRGVADCVANRVEYVELTTDLKFQERFADALMFGNGSQT